MVGLALSCRHALTLQAVHWAAVLESFLGNAQVCPLSHATRMLELEVHCDT